ncbi:MAG: hypothetical protein UT53_C0042G0006 [Candidatus Yanofskybacteria bacterium GW2011_GWD2_39_48]|uniref:Uncharacterized protein n=1 Tax=Candidatus Yanofskybacteria bacterium GW2011_GWD2_39_48 TaxID=1619031 RepID=A0A0G0RIK1_9BACT|nr:MAG: hypothetical protein UT53_C0042G0006 [Candidatus Yanofskybacteria bacterium GW2011_GWD2_39_48]
MTMMLQKGSWNELFSRVFSWRFVFTLLGIIGICVEVFYKNKDAGEAGTFFLIIGCGLYIAHAVINDSKPKGS